MIDSVLTRYFRESIIQRRDAPTAPENEAAIRIHFDNLFLRFMRTGSIPAG